jgi:hypothetical protein
MPLCVPCHQAHHARTRPVALAALPEEAVAFAVRLLGEDRAHTYLARRYAA